MAAVDDPRLVARAQALYGDGRGPGVRDVAKALGVSRMTAARLIHGDRMYGREPAYRERARSGPPAPRPTPAPPSRTAPSLPPLPVRLPELGPDQDAFLGVISQRAILRPDPHATGQARRASGRAPTFADVLRAFLGVRS